MLDANPHGALTLISAETRFPRPSGLFEENQWHSAVLNDCYPESGEGTVRAQQDAFAADGPVEDPPS